MQRFDFQFAAGDLPPVRPLRLCWNRRPARRHLRTGVEVDMTVALDHVLRAAGSAR